jgi:hypothetical protein
VSPAFSRIRRRRHVLGFTFARRRAGAKAGVVARRVAPHAS